MAFLNADGGRIFIGNIQGDRPTNKIAVALGTFWLINFNNKANLLELITYHSFLQFKNTILTI